MRFALFTFTLFLAAVSGSFVAPGPARNEPRPRDSSVVTVMTFNIQHGIDGKHHYGLQTAIDTIAAIHPDIVGLQEVTRNHPRYNCEDQPALLADGLSRATGEHWTAVYRRQWFTPNKECLETGRGDAAESEGLAWLGPAPLDPPTFVELWNTGLGLETQFGRMPGVPLIVAHLASQKVHAPDRVKQIAKLLPWADHLKRPRILVGDFNASPEYAELAPVLQAYHDAWTDAVKAGTARGRLDGLTHKRSRIDYILYLPGGDIHLAWAETVDTVPLIGREASDHRPLVAAFRVE